jgi:invasion protein IalB
MVNAMRSGQTAVIKGVSAKGTQSSDTFTLKGMAQALDRAAQECK